MTNTKWKLLPAFLMMFMAGPVGCDDSSRQHDQTDQRQAQAQQGGDHEAPATHGQDDAEPIPPNGLERYAELTADVMRSGLQMEFDGVRIICECTDGEPHPDALAEPESVDPEAFAESPRQNIDECLDEHVFDESAIEEVSGCIQQELLGFGEPPPASVLERVECTHDTFRPHEECLYDAIQEPEDVCTEDVWASVAECGESPDTHHCDGHLDEEARQWLDDLHDQTDLNACYRRVEQY